MELHLIRHTPVLVDREVCYGRSEMELAAGFEDAVLDLKSKLAPNFDRVISSPSQRCVRLAATFGGYSTDPRLQEYDFGDWELQPWDSIESTALDNWMKDFVNQRPPNGETVVEMSDRIANFIDELRQPDSTRVLLTTHAGVIRCIWAALLNIPLAQIFKLHVGYGTVTRVDLGENSAYDKIWTE